MGPFTAPTLALTPLGNGLPVYHLSKGCAPLLTLGFVTRRGSNDEPVDRPGLATLAATMLTSGSAGQSEAAFAARVDALGATLNVSATGDSTLVTLTGLPATFPDLVQRLADLVLRPNLDPGVWEKAKVKAGADLQAAQADPSAAASAAFLAALFEPSAQGHGGQTTPAALAAMTLDDVRTWLQAFAPGNSALIVVTGLAASETLPALAKAFGGWQATAPAALVLQAAPPARASLNTVDFPGRGEAVVQIGQACSPGGTREDLALALVNQVLGVGYFSRLNVDLEQTHHDTWGVGSTFGPGRHPGNLTIQFSTDVANTGAAIAESLKQVQGLLDGPPSPAELEAAKDALAYRLVNTLQSSANSAPWVADLFTRGLPADYLATYVGLLRSLDAATVAAAARRILQPAAQTVVVAGDVQAILPQLAAAGLQLPSAQARTPLGARA